MFRPFQKTLALLLTLLWVGAPMAAVVHASLEQHSYCAEHQVLEHSEANSESDAQQQPPDPIAAFRGERPADHDECFASEDCIVGSGLVAHDVLASSAPPNTHGAVARLENLIDAAPITPILAAPKNSPPSRLA